MLLLLKIVLLVLCANGAPVLARRLLPSIVLSRAIDNGMVLSDQQPLLGTSKTWRGLIASLLLTSLLAWLMGLTLVDGFLIAVFAMTGDLISSFSKRRLAYPVSSKVTGLDQIPESLLPWIYATVTYQLPLYYPVAGITVFFILELLLSKILYKWGVRKHPY